MHTQSNKPSRQYRLLFIAAFLVALGALPLIVSQAAQAGPEAYLRIEGDPIDVEVEEDGQMGVWFEGQQEYYGTYAKGSMLFIDGVGYDFGTGPAKSCTTPNQFTPVSHTQIDPWTIETVYDAGSSARVTQRTEYVNGRGYYKMTWRVLNTSGATLSNLALLHGGDTYFQGDDQGRTNWDPVLGMVYIFNQGVSGVMGLYGDPSTPADHYYGGQYSCSGGNWEYMVGGSLPDTVDQNYLDAGYSLEWDLTSLDAGEEWVVIGYEQFTAAGLVQVYAPIGQTGNPNQTFYYTFTIQNLQTVSDTFDLQAVSSNGWTVSLPNGVTITLGSFETGNVQVELTAGPTCPVTDTLTMTVTSQTDPGVTNSASVYTVIECPQGDAGIAIDPPPLEATLPPDATDFLTFTICNTGTEPLDYELVEIPAPGTAMHLDAAINTVSITETFMNDTAPGWFLDGDALLTSGGVDPSGQGWLRLTDDTGDQAGSAIYDTPFSSNDGISVTLQYATYGGSGADGFTFYLIDGETVSPTVGAPGGALGYSYNHESPIAPGVTNGYVGIGFDEFGNFSNQNYGDCNPSCPGQSPDTVAIRGSGTLDTGFNFLINNPATIETGDRSGAHTVNIVIVDQLITVRMDSGSGYVTLIDQYDLQAAPGQDPIPYTFKMGFSASTGGSTNYHEIRNLTVKGVKTSSSTTLEADPNPSILGQTVTFTATVIGAGGTPTGTVTFLEGDTVLGTGTLVNGVAIFSTAALTVGQHTVTARYEGNDEFGISTDDVMVEVQDTADIPWLSETPITGTVPPGECDTITVTFDSTGLTPGIYTGTLQIISNDPDDPIISLPVTLTVEQPTGLVIDKVAQDLNGAPLYPGDEILYTIVVTNASPSAMTGVVVSDTLPAGVDFVSASPAGYSGPNPLVWQVGDLAASATWSGEIRVVVDGSADPIGGNYAEVYSDQEPTPVHVGPIFPPPDGGDVLPGLVIDKMAQDLNGEPLYPGDAIRYTIHVTNTAAADMTGVVVTDTLPTGVVFDSAAPAGYGGPNPLVWQVGNMASGGTWTGWITVTVAPTATQIGGNYAEVSSDQQGKQQVGPITPPGGGAVQPLPSLLALSKTAVDVDGAPLYPGDEIRYTLTITNVDDSEQTGVVITDAIPNYTTYVTGSASVSQGSVSGPDPLVADIGTLAVGQVATMSFRVTVDQGASGMLVENYAQAKSDQQDPPVEVGPISPPSGGTVALPPTADLAVEKTYIRGITTITYTITATNLGPGAADGALLYDEISDFITDVSWTCQASGGAACTPTGSGNLISETITALPPGGMVIFTVGGKIPLFGDESNIVTISVPEGITDPDTSNNTATIGKPYKLLLPVIGKNPEGF